MSLIEINQLKVLIAVLEGETLRGASLDDALFENHWLTTSESGFAVTPAGRWRLEELRQRMRSEISRKVGATT
ncbi:hypothetical protein GCM10028862_05130 [Luteimonas pelagia]